MNKQNQIKHWIITGTVPEKYQICIDDNIYHMDSSSTRHHYCTFTAYGDRNPVSETLTIEITMI